MSEEIKPDKNLVAYEQAVKAYQFQVERYNTWMNYYSLFVGALFVSFYMIICYSKDINTNIIDPKHLLIFIAALGIIASICWMASLIGNCAWMNNYIRIVKENEVIFFNEKDAILNVYKQIRHKKTNEQTKKLRAFFRILIFIPKSIIQITWLIPKYIFHFIRWIFFKDNTFPRAIPPYRATYISTQKTTQWFVGAVLAAWIYILISLCTERNGINIQDCEIVNIGFSILASVGIGGTIWYIFKRYTCRTFSDDLSNM